MINPIVFVVFFPIVFFCFMTYPSCENQQLLLGCFAYPFSLFVTTNDRLVRTTSPPTPTSQNCKLSSLVIFLTQTSLVAALFYVCPFWLAFGRSSIPNLGGWQKVLSYLRLHDYGSVRDSGILHIYLEHCLHVIELMNAVSIELT